MPKALWSDVCEISEKGQKSESEKWFFRALSVDLTMKNWYRCSGISLRKGGIEEKQEVELKDQI
jgi:hypothetical protein